jgi:hypothetical protein
VLLGVLVLVRSEELLPLGLESSTALSDLGIRSLGGVGDDKAGLGVESKLGLDVGGIVGLEGCYKGLVWAKKRGYENSRAPWTPWVPWSFEP